jgi:hypothetical protein
MKIDTEHLHYWMQAIRKSNDPMRTMDAFWSGQIKSKEWLILTLENLIPTIVNIDIYGGWVGVLASMLFQSKLSVNTIRSIDVDPQCEPIANIMNNIELNKGKFKAITANMINVTSTANVVINTSCEHISQNEYNDWIKKISDNSLLVLQSNNYKISEHIRVANTVEEFVDQSNLKKVLFKEELSLPLYNRYMIIGYK